MMKAPILSPSGLWDQPPLNFLCNRTLRSLFYSSAHRPDDTKRLKTYIQVLVVPVAAVEVFNHCDIVCKLR
jgi:hypothetical protein